MKYQTIGKSNLQASAVSLGTWAIGGGTWWGENEDKNSIRTIQEAIDYGINLVDTAPVYGFGHSEEVVGKALQGRRHKVLVSTKCGLWWHSNEGSPFFNRDGHTVTRNLTANAIRQEVDLSLKRLNTDYIDIYFTHWQAVPPCETPIEETMSALLELKRAGKIRAIGASNTTPRQVKEYLKYGQLDIIQEKYSMLDRVVEKELLSICNQEQITMQAYSPLEQGLLAGKISMEYQVTPGEAREDLIWVTDLNKRKQALDMLAGWQDLLKKYECSFSNLVVAWTLNRNPQINCLCGARKTEHLLDNAKGGGLVLEAGDLARMTQDIERL